MSENHPHIFLLGEFSAQDLLELHSKVFTKIKVTEVSDISSLNTTGGINLIVSKDLQILQNLRKFQGYTIWLNTTSIVEMQPSAMAKFPKFAKPNKIITTLGQIEFLLQGNIAENFDDLRSDQYFFMIYDFDHLTKFEKKKLQV